MAAALGAALQRVAVPLRQLCTGFVSTLAKIENRLVRRGRSADVVVVEKKFAQLRIPMRGARANRLFLEPCWRRHRIRVKSRLLVAPVPGPESAANYFMRVSLPRHGICAFGQRTAPSRKTRHRQIHGAPEEMYRAALTQKRRAELLEDAVRIQQDPPKILGVFPIVG